MSISYTQSAKILDKEFGSTSYTVQSSYYIGLSTVDSVTIGSDGSGVVEPSGGDYARVAIANNKTSWGNTSSGTLSNLISITFPTSTASWGTIKAVVLFSAATGGTALYFEDLPSDKSIPSGTTAYLSPGDIDITMSDNITYTQSAKILDGEFGSTSYSPQGTYYVGLSTTPISADGTGATEPSGGSYARVAVVNNKTNWTAASFGTLSNATSITFAESTASWGTITHVALFSAASGGNVLYYGTLDSARAVANETSVIYDIGGFEVEIVNP